MQSIYNRTTYPLMNEQTVWANPVYVEGFLEEDVPAPEERPESRSDVTTVATEIDIVELREEDERDIAEDASLKKYTAWNCKRNEERAKLEAEAEEVWEFKVGDTQFDRNGPLPSGVIRNANVWFGT